MAGPAKDEGGLILGINVTPLVDITLVLLIIFMATAHLIAHRSMTLSLPKVSHHQEIPTPSIQVQLEADQSLTLNGRSVTLQELAYNLTSMARLDPSLRVTLAADRRVSWGDVAQILDAVRGAGITRIATEVEPK